VFLDSDQADSPLDLQAQHRDIREEVLSEVTRVIDSQKFILGQEVQQLEASIAGYSNCPHAIGCASGSDALFLALLALGVEPGDEVLIPPYTFFATAGAVVRAGARPVFVDVDADTFNMDVQRAAEAIEKHPRARVMIPVHLFGACADMDGLREAARGREMFFIEDAAQSIGAEYRGRRAGSMGHIGCFSFFPSKNLGCYGDGGMLTTTDSALAERLMTLRVHGAKKKYVHQYVGINSRLDALQAAVLRVKLRRLDSWTAARQRNAALYRNILGGMDLPVRAPEAASHTTRHVYNQFVVLCERRDELQAYLKENGIGTEVYYPLPLHRQECFQDLGYKANDFPVSEKLAKHSLALPVYAELASGDVEHVCRTIESFYRK
jgi:dTDP-4-amino-4,6-dideoxygalactose transaminase